MHGSITGPLRDSSDLRPERVLVLCGVPFLDGSLYYLICKRISCSSSHSTHIRIF